MAIGCYKYDPKRGSFSLPAKKNKCKPAEPAEIRRAKAELRRTGKRRVSVNTRGFYASMLERSKIKGLKLRVKVRIDRNKGYKAEAKQIAKLLQDNPKLKIKVGDYTVELSSDAKTVVINDNTGSPTSVALNKVLSDVFGWEGSGHKTRGTNHLPKRILESYSRVASDKLPATIDLKADFTAAKAKYAKVTTDVDPVDLASVPKEVRPTPPYSGDQLNFLAADIAGSGKTDPIKIKVKGPDGNDYSLTYVAWEKYTSAAGVVRDGKVSSGELVEYLKATSKGREVTISSGDYRYTVKDGKILPDAVDWKAVAAKASDQKARAKIDRIWDDYSVKGMTDQETVGLFNKLYGLKIDPNAKEVKVSDLKAAGSKVTGVLTDLIDRGSDINGSSDGKWSISDIRNHLATLEYFARRRHLNDQNPNAALHKAASIYNDKEVLGYEMVPKSETKEALAWADSNFAGVNTLSGFLGKITNPAHNAAMAQYAKFAGIGPILTAYDLVVLKDIYVGLSRLAQLPPSVLDTYFGIKGKLEKLAAFTAKNVKAYLAGGEMEEPEVDEVEEGGDVVDGEEEGGLTPEKREEFAFGTALERMQRNNWDPKSAKTNVSPEERRMLGPKGSYRPEIKRSIDAQIKALSTPYDSNKVDQALTRAKVAVDSKNWSAARVAYKEALREARKAYYGTYLRRRKDALVFKDGPSDRLALAIGEPKRGLRAGAKAVYDGFGKIDKSIEALLALPLSQLPQSEATKFAALRKGVVKGQKYDPIEKKFKVVPLDTKGITDEVRSFLDITPDDFQRGEVPYGKAQRELMTKWTGEINRKGTPKSMSTHIPTRDWHPANKERLVKMAAAIDKFVKLVKAGFKAKTPKDALAAKLDKWLEENKDDLGPMGYMQFKRVIGNIREKGLGKAIKLHLKGTDKEAYDAFKSEWGKGGGKRPSGLRGPKGPGAGGGAGGSGGPLTGKATVKFDTVLRNATTKAKIRKLKSGTVVEIVGKKGAWYEIVVGKETGVVAASSLTK